MHALRAVVVVAAAALLALACAPDGFWAANRARHSEPTVAACKTVPGHALAEDDEPCRRALIERHERYDLAFAEFSERGNAFDRKNLDLVVACARSSRAGPCAEHAPPEQPRNVIVFIHGWKHDGGPDDGNVKSFREALDHLARVSPGRRPFGIYVGWRGATLRLDGFANLTFWDRKGAAQEVGKGGVTELLLRLDAAVHDEAPERESDALLIVGHSFGGAIALSSLTEVFLDRIVRIGGESCQQNADPAAYQACCQALPRVDPIGNGVILLNPAIEANEALQLKELVNERRGCFPANQPNVLTSISSKEDKATRFAFPIGMALRLLFWDEEDLPREYGTLRENRVGIETVGNLPEFRTVAFSVDSRGLSFDPCKEPEPENCVKGEEERYRRNYIGPFDNEPVEFLYTDRAFIEDHNDVFNQKVKAYLATLANLSAWQLQGRPFRRECVLAGEFRFADCYNEYFQAFRELSCEDSPGAEGCSPSSGG